LEGVVRRQLKTGKEEEIKMISKENLQRERQQGKQDRGRGRDCEILNVDDDVLVDSELVEK